MSVSPSHIAQIVVVVRDQERAKAFYRDTMGLQHLFDAPPQMSFFQCGQTRLMLAPPEGPETAGISIIFYSVDDIEGSFRELKEKGAPIDKEPHVIARVGDKDIWIAGCRDPDGNMVGLMSERPAAASSEPA